MKKDDNAYGTAYYRCPKCKHSAVAEKNDIDLPTETQIKNVY
jgi:hypothetical protein